MRTLRETETEVVEVTSRTKRVRSVGEKLRRKRGGEFAGSIGHGSIDEMEDLRGVRVVIFDYR